MDSKTIVVNEIYKIGQGGGSVLFFLRFSLSPRPLLGEGAEELAQYG